MEFRLGEEYQQKFPKEEDLWVNRSVSHRLWKAASIGFIGGAFTGSIASFWYDYPQLQLGDGYGKAFRASVRVTTKVAVAFASVSLAYQATVEMINAYQERRTAAGPFIGGIVAGGGLGLIFKAVKTGLGLGLIAGAGAAYFGHNKPFSRTMAYRERDAERHDATVKFRYLKALETREARERARLAELAALKEFNE